MRGIFITSVCIIVIFFTTIGYGTLRKESGLKQHYRRALSTGTDAAMKHTTYVEEEQLKNLSFGFGTGYEHSNNIEINKDEALKWFYALFFRSIGINEDETLQASTGLQWGLIP